MKRTVNGLTLISDGDKTWRTADGRFRVEYDEQGLTECENPHPVKQGREWSHCPGGEFHPYYGWHVWDTVRDDYTFDIRNIDTFTEAAEMLAADLAKEAKP